MLKLKCIPAIWLIVQSFSQFKAQTIVDFESLVVPVAGFYNGLTDHSGTIGSTETFFYQEDGANFYVVYTLENTYGFWNGFAYSNQTDLQTADWTNYSAYADPPGGANGSNNYVFAYIPVFSADSVMFDNPVIIQSVDITNTVWAYKFMTGEDGTGHNFTTGDFFTLTMKGIKPDGSLYENPVTIMLAENTTILNNWSTFNISFPGSIIGMIFSLSASDDWTPNYFCLDNIVYSYASVVEDLPHVEITIAPNPADEYFKVVGIQKGTFSIYDINGKKICTQYEINSESSVDISFLKSGAYFLVIQDEGTIVNKILMVN
jgi:hypothetical protein